MTDDGVASRAEADVEARRGTLAGTTSPGLRTGSEPLFSSSLGALESDLRLTARCIMGPMVGDGRAGSVKRVASVGEGASVVHEIHEYLARQ